MAAKPKEYKRLNRAVPVAEALSGALDPALRKRGFASRDLVTHWTSIVPPPYDGCSRPDKLSWPRGERRAEGGVLYLRCAPAQRLALQHEGPRVAAAINSYFGFAVVSEVRISPNPFQVEPSQPRVAAQAGKAAEAAASLAVSGIADPEFRAALEQLGRGVLSGRKERP